LGLRIISIHIEPFNRFDVAPSDGSHCGEYRIVYTKRSGIANSLVRNLIIFEAALNLNFDLPQGSTLYGDSAFTLDYLEEVMWEGAGINFSPMRKKNSTRPMPVYIAYLQARGRKMIETAGSPTFATEAC
jgi:hypothetical protein